MKDNNKRPISFEEFIGQNHLKNILQTAIQSAKVMKRALWHCLFTGESGYGKTTLASIVAQYMDTRVKQITAYAINKPSDMVSLLNTLDTNDILFIDEIHRLKPSVEEVLYIAMEDYAIDMLMPDGTHIRLPLRPFTLIWATTKPENLSQPFKNRFIYDCYFLPYSKWEKQEIIKRYLIHEELICEDSEIIEMIEKHVSNTPREIANFCVMLHDFCKVHHYNKILNKNILNEFHKKYQRLPGWLTPIHQQYLDILKWRNWNPIWIKSISMQLWIHELTIEKDIEPQLFKLNYIEKTSRGRILIFGEKSEKI